MIVMGISFSWLLAMILFFLVSAALGYKIGYDDGYGDGADDLETEANHRTRRSPL